MNPNKQRETVIKIVATGLDINQSVILVGVSVQLNEDPHRDRTITVIELAPEAQDTMARVGNY